MACMDLLGTARLLLRGRRDRDRVVVVIGPDPCLSHTHTEY